jgi:anti-anti-sigma factor
MLINRPVIVMQSPEQLIAGEVGKFLQDLEPLLEVSRPRIVLDCSQVRNIDSAGVEILLHCVEECMKRDGDLKLASVSSESRVMLELMRVDRVFEIFESSEEAVRSFNVLPVEAVVQDDPWYQPAFGDVGPLKQAS